MSQSILRIMERFGVPVAILFVILFFIREACISLNATVVIPVVKSHTQFLESTSETLHEIADTQLRQTMTLQELAIGQKEIQHVLTRPLNSKGLD